MRDPAPPSALLWVKHGLDRALGLVLLIALLPLFAVIALAIAVTSGRPVFFAQERAGQNGRRFRMLKFRTMVVGAEKHREALGPLNELRAPVFKSSRDPRVTPIGRWLRETSLDELPQLVHVVAGTMSLVGPRPLPIDEQRQLRGWHQRRLMMRPGLTGVWQVSGRCAVPFEEWMEMDLRYVDNWSLRLDLMVLARTVPAVISRRGAL